MRIFILPDALRPECHFERCAIVIYVHRKDSKGDLIHRRFFLFQLVQFFDNLFTLVFSGAVRIYDKRDLDTFTFKP